MLVLYLVRDARHIRTDEFPVRFPTLQFTRLIRLGVFLNTYPCTFVYDVFT